MCECVYAGHTRCKHSVSDAYYDDRLGVLTRKGERERERERDRERDGERERERERERQTQRH